MPNRILREAIITSRAVSQLSDSGQLFYRCLMSVVDDYGRFEADLDIIRARCFPRQLDRWPLSRVGGSLAECGEARSSDGAPLLILYSCPDDSKEYLQINNFGQRIRSDKKGSATPSKYPAPTVAEMRGGSRASSGELRPESLAESLAEAEAQTAPLPPLQTQTEWPLTTAAIFAEDPAIDQIFILRLAQESYQHCISAGIMDPITDDDLSAAVLKSFKSYTGRTRHGPGLLLKRVPQILVNWWKENENGISKENDTH